MSTSPKLENPFADNVGKYVSRHHDLNHSVLIYFSLDQSVSAIVEEPNNNVQGPPLSNAQSRANTTSFEGPPVYQHPYIPGMDTKGEFQVAPIQQFSSPVAPSRTIHISSATQAEWFETLRELQANLTDLRAARGKMFKFRRFTLSCAPRSWRSHRLLRVEESLRELRVLEELVLAGMHRLAQIHPDPIVQAEWGSRADEFSRSMYSNEVDGMDEEGGNIALSGAEEASANDLEGARAGRFKRRASRLAMKSEDDSILMSLLKGVGILICTPIALAGAAAFGGGVMLYGCGKVIVGLGHMMTFGKLR